MIMMITLMTVLMMRWSTIYRGRHDYDDNCDYCVDDEVLYHLQYGSGRVVPFGTGKFFAS